MLKPLQVQKTISYHPLEGLLEDEKPQVRQYALKALARIGKVNKERLEPIIENPEEKGYNVSLARQIIKKAKTA